MPFAPLISARVRYVAAFSSAAIILVGGVGVATGLRRLSERRQRLANVQAVIRANDNLLQRLTDAETGQRGYIIVGDPRYLDPYRGAKADVTRSLQRLHELASDDREGLRLVTRLSAVVQERLDTLERRIATRSAAGFDIARTAVIQGGGRELMDSVRKVSGDIERRYVGVEARQIAMERTDARLLLFGSIVGAVIGAVIAYLLNRLLLRADGRQRELADRLRVQNEELELRAAEADRERERAEAATHAKSAFIATISHDIRTPLNAIVGYADLLDSDAGGSLHHAQRDYVRRILTSSRYLTALINDILTLARLEAGLPDNDRERVLVGDFLSSIEPMVAPQLRMGELHYGTSHACGAPSRCGSCVMANPEKLRQLVLNLVANAIKFTGKQGQVEVRCACDVTSVSISVRDSGIGIPRDRLEDVFKPYTQLRVPTRTGDKAGFGLGLAISRELARSMGGDLTVASVEGEGSTFTLSLPRAPATDATAIAT